MDNKNVFATLVDQYKGDYWRSDEENVVNRFFPQIFPNRKATMLVLGCGAGRTLPYLAAKGYDITAIDNVPEMVAAAKEKVRDLKNVKVMEMDATHLTFAAGSFDYVFFPFHGLGCVYPDIYAAVSEIARVLTPQGTYAGNMHNRFYIKSIRRAFNDDAFTQDPTGARLYLASRDDLPRMRRYFFDVKIIARKKLQNRKGFTWKDYAYILLPYFDKSLYFICTKPKW